MLDKFLDYVNRKDYDQIQAENGLEEGEILLPDLGNVFEFVMVPVSKYEMLVRESEKLTAVTRYACSDKPYMSAIKAILEV